MKRKNHTLRNQFILIVTLILVGTACTVFVYNACASPTGAAVLSQLIP